MRGPSAASTVAAWAVLASLVLAACTPLYLPPLPGDALVPAPRLRLAGTSVLGHVDGRLQLRIDAVEVPDEGWLAVQWFGPAGPARASESIWLAPGDEARPHLVTSPPQLEVSAGEWRAVVSWDGAVVRQFRIVVSGTPDAPGAAPG